MKTTQHEAILKHLRNGRKLTPLDAMTLPDIKSMKLSSRIGEIRKSMLNKDESILDAWTKVPSGKKVKVYFLVKIGQLNIF